MPPTRLVLVRHGESMATVNGVVGGPKGDTGLSPAGREQARRLRDRLRTTRELRPDAVLASVLPRAVETAELVWPDADLVTDCDWCELHPGECDGLAWSDYQALYDDAPDDPDRPMSPGGESLRAFDARVRAAVDALLAERAGQSTLLFTHGGFIVAATLHLLGVPGIGALADRTFRLDPRNTSITEFVLAEGNDRWTLERYNDIAHLALSR